MNFQWSDDQIELRDRVIQFAQNELGRDFSERESNGEFSSEDWRRCANFGIQGMPIPKEYGGSGTGDILTTTLAMESMGYGCRDLGLLFGLSAQVWTVQMPILEFGTESQKVSLLPSLCDGSVIAADAMTEPEAGSDVFSLTTSAERCDGGYRLKRIKVLDHVSADRRHCVDVCNR